MWPRRSGTKYGNVKTTYNGQLFDSKREAGHAALLDQLRRATNISERVAAVQSQVKFPIEVNEKKIATYVADFVVRFADGREEIHEVKGMKTAVYRLKKKLIEALYGVKILEF